jgi:hypothetical protein
MSGQTNNRRSRGGKRAQRANRNRQTPVIRKAYLYDASAGEENILTFADFADTHIQDDDAALTEVMSLLSHGESINDAMHDGVMETYTVADRVELVAQLRELAAENPDLFTGHEALIATLDAEPTSPRPVGSRDPQLTAALRLLNQAGEEFGGEHHSDGIWGLSDHGVQLIEQADALLSQLDGPAHDCASRARARIHDFRFEMREDDEYASERACGFLDEAVAELTKQRVS